MYLICLQQEAAWDVPHNRPPANWPEKGEIKFLKYQTRYREGLDLVLKGITCSVLPGEKASGICSMRLQRRAVLPGYNCMDLKFGCLCLSPL